MKRHLAAALCASLVAASQPHAGWAQGFLPGERARAVRMACAADYMRYCGDVPIGGGRIVRCLTRHADVVSQRCFQALTVWGLTAVNAFKACLPDADRLCASIQDVKDRVRYCSVCSNITDVDPCFYCTHPDRDARVICVVEEPQNVSAIEKTRELKGR